MALAIIGLGANLPSPRFGPPRATLEAAVDDLARRLGPLIAQSRWFETEPVPKSDQPWFVNGVAVFDTDRQPIEILEILHSVEEAFGRVRQKRWEARLLDLDLLAVDDRVASHPCLPHPRLHERLFVLLPLQDVAPQWRHPTLGKTAAELARALPEGEVVRPLQGETKPV